MSRALLNANLAVVNKFSLLRVSVCTPDVFSNSYFAQNFSEVLISPLWMESARHISVILHAISVQYAPELQSRFSLGGAVKFSIRL